MTIYSNKRATITMLDCYKNVEHITVKQHNSLMLEKLQGNLHEIPLIVHWD